MGRRRTLVSRRPAKVGGRRMIVKIRDTEIPLEHLMYMEIKGRGASTRLCIDWNYGGGIVFGYDSKREAKADYNKIIKAIEETWRRRK